MTQIHVLIDDGTMPRRLPGADRFLSISAAYLAATPAVPSSKASNGAVPAINRPVPMAATETSGARL
jgi:hypothetical protein